MDVTILKLPAQLGDSGRALAIEFLLLAPGATAQIPDGKAFPLYHDLDLTGSPPPADESDKGTEKEKTTTGVEELWRMAA